MRRRSENLHVLAGTEHVQHSARTGAAGHRRGPEHAGPVRSSGTSCVRIAALPRAHVAGFAADDLSHLLAELMENATSFSPQDLPVEVSGWLLENGEVMLSVQDEGIGIATRAAPAAQRPPHRLRPGGALRPGGRGRSQSTQRASWPGSRPPARGARAAAGAEAGRCRGRRGPPERPAHGGPAGRTRPERARVRTARGPTPCRVPTRRLAPASCTAARRRARERGVEPAGHLRGNRPVRRAEADGGGGSRRGLEAAPAPAPRTRTGRSTAGQRAGTGVGEGTEGRPSRPGGDDPESDPGCPGVRPGREATGSRPARPRPPRRRHDGPPAAGTGAGAGTGGVHTEPAPRSPTAPELPGQRSRRPLYAIGPDAHDRTPDKNTARAEDAPEHPGPPRPARPSGPGAPRPPGPAGNHRARHPRRACPSGPRSSAHPRQLHGGFAPYRGFRRRGRCSAAAWEDSAGGRRPVAATSRRRSPNRTGRAGAPAPPQREDHRRSHGGTVEEAKSVTAPSTFTDSAVSRSAALAADQPDRGVPGILSRSRWSPPTACCCSPPTRTASPRPAKAQAVRRLRARAVPPPTSPPSSPASPASPSPRRQMDFGNVKRDEGRHGRGQPVRDVDQRRLAARRARLARTPTPVSSPTTWRSSSAAPAVILTPELRSELRKSWSRVDLCGSTR